MEFENNAKAYKYQHRSKATKYIKNRGLGNSGLIPNQH